MIMILKVMITILISRTRPRTPGVRLLAPLVGIALLITACGSDTGSELGRPLIVATTSVWGDVVGQLVGDDADVEVLIPRGVDSHDFEPTSREVALLHDADLVVANGLGLEAGLVDVLESAAEEGANIVEMAPLLDPIAYDDHDHDESHEGEGHDHGDLDPHVWLDLTRVEMAVRLIADRLVTVDDAADWVGRAEAYSGELLQADEMASDILRVVEPAERRLVTNHEALGYFAARYGFEVVGVVIPGGSTLAEPSSLELAALVEEIQQEGLNAIFADTTSPTRLAETVAEEAGEEVSVVELYTESLGEPGSDGDTLVGMVLADARLIADALTR